MDFVFQKLKVMFWYVYWKVKFLKLGFKSNSKEYNGKTLTDSMEIGFYIQTSRRSHIISRRRKLL